MCVNNQRSNNIHKQVIVDVRNFLEEGHAYVALSRARSPEGLQVKNFKPDSIKTNESALMFHHALSAQQSGVQPLLKSPRMWWAPLLIGSDETIKWLPLFMTSKHFRDWVSKYGSGDGPMSAVDAQMLQELVELQTRKCHTRERDEDVCER
jgi:hypothetical protein